MRGEKERQDQATKLAVDLLEQFKSLYLYSLREVLFEKSVKEFHIADGASINVASPSVRRDKSGGVSSPRRNRSPSADNGNVGGVFNLHRRSQSNTSSSVLRGSASSSSPGLRKESSTTPGGLRRESSTNSSNQDKRKSRVMEAIGNVLRLSSTSSPSPHSIMDKLALIVPTINFSTKVICAQAVELPHKTYIVRIVASEYLCTNDNLGVCCFFAAWR